jgi:hypothetical protein
MASASQPWRVVHRGTKILSASRNLGRLSLRTKWCHYVFMAKRVRTLKRVASGASQIQSKSALARAKRAARSELRRIFDEELKERESERRSLSRPAAASHSHS